MEFIFFTLLQCQRNRSSLNSMQGSVAKRGVINDCLNEQFGRVAEITIKGAQ
jgi:hypothetical protein